MRKWCMRKCWGVLNGHLATEAERRLEKTWKDTGEKRKMLTS